LKEALLLEGARPDSEAGFGSIHGDEFAPDPSTVDQVGRPGVPRDRGEGTLNR